MKTTMAWGWRLRQLTDGLPGATLAALVYGGWAAWANAAAGLTVASTVAATHAVLSAGLTFFGTALMRLFFRAGPSPGAGARLAFIGGLAATYSVLISVHTLIGTPFLFLTLAAGVVPNFLFCGAYALLLSRTGVAA